MGNIYPDYVKITNVIFVPSGKTASGEIAIDNELLGKLLVYNSKVFNESRVGWFITKPQIDSDVAIIHKHLLPSLKSQTNNWAGPLILLIDPTLENDKINLNGYVSQPNKMFRECFAMFQPVKINVELFDESLATGQLLYGNTNKRMYNETNEKGLTFSRALTNATAKLQELKEKLSKMTQEDILANPDLVRDLKSLLAARFSAVNDNNPKELDRFVEDNHHLRYLTDIAQIQLIVSEKLNKVDHHE